MKCKIIKMMQIGDKYQNLIVNVAVGVYTITGSEDVSQALAEADKDMYENKRQIKKNDQS